MGGLVAEHVGHTPPKPLLTFAVRPLRPAMPRAARLPPARVTPRKAPHSHRTRAAAPDTGKGHRSGYGGKGQAQSLQRRPRLGRLLQCARRRCPRVGLGTGRESHSFSAYAHVQEPAPAPYVGEMKNAAQFWCDRVIKQYKETSVDCKPRWAQLG